jgi:hypothetical protein
MWTSTEWTPSKHVIKRIKKGKRAKVVFQRKNNDKEIRSISTTCSCTAGEYNKKTKELTVTYVAKFPSRKTLPVHISTQIITIIYTDNSIDKLQIQANVYR